jgi:hypothetical protein
MKRHYYIIVALVSFLSGLVIGYALAAGHWF